MGKTLSEKMEPLELEFKTFLSRNPSSMSLIEKIVEDGTMSLKIAFSEDKKFTLVCPKNYPNYDQDQENFFVDDGSSGLGVWSNEINEFLLDNQFLTLDAVLSKALNLYIKNNTKKTAQVCSDESEDEYMSDDEEETEMDDSQMEDILDENLSKELEFVRLKKRWKAKEAELRAEREQQFGMDEGEECDDQGVTLKRQPKQVFRYILTNIRLGLLIRFYYWYLMTNLTRWLIK